MASSEENPAATADANESSDGGGKQAQASEKPKKKKKTLIGLGKLRESLNKKKASSGKKSTSLRIPKPSRKRKTTSLGLPRPGAEEEDEASDEQQEADEPITDRVEDLPQETFDDEEPDTDRLEELPEDLAEDGPNTDRIEDLPEEDFEAEATMLTDGLFDKEAPGAFGAEPAEEFAGEATMVTDSPLSDDEPDLDEEFEVEATMVTDSMMGAETSVGEEFEGGEKTTVSLHGSPAMTAEQGSSAPDANVPATHTTNPNPPTPEQKPRTNSFSPPASGSSPNVQVEPELVDAADTSADDFSAEKTEVFESPYENEALVARLSVLSGPAAGQEFLLNKQRNTIGRGKNNTIIVSDLAMSRQHFEILENNDQSFLLVDLQSANGTRLNSTRIQEAELLHGDRIEAGKTELQFVIPGDRPQPRSRNRHLIPKREVETPDTRTQVRQMNSGEVAGDDTTDKILTYVIIGAGVLSLFLIGAAAYLFVNDSGGKQAEAAATATEDPKVQALYLDGVEKVKDRDWDAARKVFTEVASVDADFAGVDAQLARVDREQKAQQALDHANALFDEGKGEEAAEVAQTISNESVYFEEAQELLRKTRQRRVSALYQKAQEAVTDEKVEQAKKHLAAILAEVPNHKGALELQKALEEPDEEEEEDEAGEEERSSRPARTARTSSSSSDDLFANSGSRSARSNSGSGTRINFTKGFSLYKAGKFSQAASYFRDAASGSGGALADRANETANNIDKFDRTYQRATRAFSAGVWKTAIDALQDAKRADRSVARTGYFKSEINAKLAAAHAKIGLGEYTKGSYATAYRHYAKSERYDSSNSTGNTLRRKLSTKARSLYIQAANKRKTDPKAASNLCRQIIAMTPSSHSMHKKAKKMLAEL